MHTAHASSGRHRPDRLPTALLIRLGRYLRRCLVSAAVVAGMGSTTLSAASVVSPSWYVAPDGDDANAGTAAAPFRSLTKLATVLTAGDHAYVRGGTYAIHRALPPGQSFESLHSLAGTAAQPIVVENYPGERPVFDFAGSTYTGGANGLYIIGSDHLRLKGLRFTNLAQMPDG